MRSPLPTTRHRSARQRTATPQRHVSHVKEVTMHEIASLGRWIKLRRIVLELSQAELARLVGCAEITIRKIEADERRPSVQLAERLAARLELEPEERAAFVQAVQA